MNNEIELKNSTPVSFQANEENFAILYFGMLYGETERIYVVVRFTIVSMSKNIDVTIPLTDVETKNLTTYLPQGWVMKNVTYKKQVEVLRTSIRNALALKQDFRTFLPQGYNNINDQWVYTMGDYIIGKQVNPNWIAHNPLGSHAKASYRKEVKNSGLWVELFIEQGMSRSALLLASLTPYLYPITSTLNFPEKALNAYVVGETSSFKTSFAKLLTSKWDDSSAGVNLGCDTKVFYREISKYLDQVILIDDLNLAPTNGSREMVKRLERLSELLQLSSAGGVAEVKHQTFNKDRLGLIVTAEYIPNSATKINRSVIIRFTEGIDEKDLTTLQRYQKLYLVFVMNFIDWLLRNFDRNLSMIKEHMEKNGFQYRGSHASASEYMGFMRIMASYKVLTAARLLLIAFFQDTGVLEKKKCIELSNSLSKSIDMVIADTLDAVHKGSDITPAIKTVCNIFGNDEFDVVAKNISEYLTEKKTIFIYHEGRYYFKIERLVEHLRKEYGISININSLSKELSKADLLVKFGDGKSGKLPSDLITYFEEFYDENLFITCSKDRYMGRHFALDETALADMVERECPEMLYRLYSPIDQLRITD